MLEAFQKIAPKYIKRSDSEDKSRKETACQTAPQSDPSLEEVVTATEEKVGDPFEILSFNVLVFSHYVFFFFFFNLLIYLFLDL